MRLSKQVFKFTWLVFFTVSLLMTGSSFADQRDPLQIIDLKNRPADEIIPVLKPMLKPNDAITGTGFQLFLRTDAKTLEEVTRLLQVMDKASRNLVIKVRNTLDADSKSVNISSSVNYEVIDDVRVVGGSHPPRDNGAKVSINSNKNTAHRNTEHLIRVIEGGKAFITAGEIRPYEHRTIIRHRNGVSIYDRVDYQNVTSGFYVTPMLTGNNNVSLQVQPHYRTVSDKRSGTIDVQEASTTLETKLGEWVQIGGIDTDENSKDIGIPGTSRNSARKQSAIYVKVELE